MGLQPQFETTKRLAISGFKAVFIAETNLQVRSAGLLGSIISKVWFAQKASI